MPENPTSLGKDILSILGEEGTTKSTFAKPIQADVASRWDSILTRGLDEETKDVLINKYLPPENCQGINPPIINPEVKIAISESVIRRYTRLMQTQQQIASSLSAIGLALTTMLDKEEGEKNRDYIELLSNAGRLLANVHFSESKSRRELIALNLNKELKETLVSTPISGLLFGNNLEDRIKTAKELEKSGQQLKPKKLRSQSSVVQSTSENYKSSFPQRSMGVRRNGFIHQAPKKSQYTHRKTSYKKGQNYYSRSNQNVQKRSRQF